MFGRAEAAASLDRTCHRRLGRAGRQFTFILAACNLIRLPKLLDAALGAERSNIADSGPSPAISWPTFSFD